MSEARMISDLAKSGLVPTDMNTVLEATDPMFGRPLGYRIPYYLADGTPHPTMWQTKLFEPKEDGQKYTQPAGVTYPYFSPRVDWPKHTATREKYIVEGAKKAAAAIKYLGIPAIGINGCYNWCGEPTKKLLRPLCDELTAIINPGDIVYVVLDGDASYNIDVEHATADLRLAILRHGATPIIVKLPDEGDSKIGLDDWIIANKATYADFMNLPTSVDGKEYRESLSSLAHRTGMTRYPTGVVHTTTPNAVLAAKATECFKDRFMYNDHEELWYYGDKPVAEHHLYAMHNELARRFFPTIGPSASLAVLGSLQTEDGYHHHPINDYLEALEWDGEERLAYMFSAIFGAEDSEYIRAIGRNFLTSAVARTLTPGCKVDTMLILEGPQGLGKSKALALMGKGSHAEATASMDTKDFIGQVQSAWFVDIAELDAMRKADIARVKGLLSMTTDHYRPPYGRVVERRPRRCVFVGSTNTSQYLVDETGGRRFWSVACGAEINFKLLEATLDQLYAEAVHRFRSGETWWEVPKQEAKEQQDKRSTTDALPWYEFIAHLVSNPAKMRKITFAGRSGLAIQPREILLALEIPLERQTIAHVRDVGRILARLGFENKHLGKTNMDDGGADLGDRQVRHYIKFGGGGGKL